MGGYPPQQVPPQGSPYGSPYSSGTTYRATTFGSAERLSNLWSGYVLLGVSFLVTVLVNVLGFYSFFRTTSPQSNYIPSLLAMMAIVMGISGLLSFLACYKIVVGMDKHVLIAVIAAFFIGLQAVLFCGLIGYICMYAWAVTEFKKYGLTQGFFGFDRSEVHDTIARLRQARSNQYRAP